MRGERENQENRKKACPFKLKKTDREVGDENGFQAMKMAFKDFLNKIIVSIWCQET